MTRSASPRREKERPRVFIDSAHLIAVANRRDTLHESALRAAETAVRQRAELVTTHAVLLEVAGTLARPPLRRFALAMLDALARDPGVTVVPVTAALFDRGFRLYRERLDQSWSLTDCISFVVMRERSISSALTADRRFEQAGFRILLR